MKEVTVYRKACGPRQGNVGDELTKIIFEHYTDLKIKIVDGEKERVHCDLLGIGSILSAYTPNSKGIVWTTGSMNNGPKNLKNARVFAVRGKKTLNLIKGCDKSKVMLGDGGLICDFARKDIPKKYKLGIIPHFVDYDDKVVKKIVESNTEIKLIDICSGFDNVTKELQSCERVISSSLHGLVLSDCFEIPNDWVKLSDKVLGKGFKFADYYSVFDITNKKPMKITTEDDLKTIFKKMDPYKRKGLDKIKRNLFKTVDRVRNSFE